MVESTLCCCGPSLDQVARESLSQKCHFHWGLNDKEYPSTRQTDMWEQNFLGREVSVKKTKV